jgi:mRNA interferase HicA
VKRRDLIREITRVGAVLERHGGKHDWYRQPETGKLQAVPRHTEVNEHLVHVLQNSGADAQA